MTEANSQRSALPEGICSLLDTDLYKLTMQCAILKYLPDVRKCTTIVMHGPVAELVRCHICIHQQDSRYEADP